MKPSDFRAVAIVVLGLMALPGVGYAAGTSSNDRSRPSPTSTSRPRT